MAEGQGQSKESKYLQSPLLHIILWPTHSPNHCLKWALPRVIQHDSTHTCLFQPTALPSSLTSTPSLPQRILYPFSFLLFFWQLLSCLDAEVCTTCTMSGLGSEGEQHFPPRAPFSPQALPRGWTGSRGPLPVAQRAEGSPAPVCRSKWQV